MGAIVAAIAATVIAAIGAKAAVITSQNAKDSSNFAATKNADATKAAADSAAEAQKEAAHASADAQVKQAEIDRLRDQDWLNYEREEADKDRKDLRDGIGYDSIFKDIDQIDTWGHDAGYEDCYA